MDELTQILAGLALCENKAKSLGDIKPALSALSRADLAVAIKDVDLVVVFDCLNTGNDQQIEVACEVIKYLLAFVDPEIVLQKYGELMRVGLDHRNCQVGVLVLEQLKRCARDEELAVKLSQHSIYLPAVRLMGSGELALAAAVAELLILVAETRAGLAVLLATPTVQVLAELSGMSDTVNCRVLDLVVKVSQLSEEHLDGVEKLGLLQPLHRIVQVEDILVRLNAVQLVTDFALTHQGLRYLEKHSLLRQMEDILRSARADPFGDLLLPALLRFFGNIAHLRPKQMLVQHPVFLETLLHTAEAAADHTLKAVAFESLGYIGVSLEGKSCLAGLGNKFINCIENLETLIQDSPTEIRIRAMNAFASLIKLDKENQSGEYLELTESWYRASLGSRNDPFGVLHAVVKQPFTELRLAIYQVLTNMARQGWGRKEILRRPGFPELLLDRGAERDKIGRDAKFALLTALIEAGDTKDIVGAELDVLLREYVRQGPHWVHVQSHVAFEEA